MTLNLPLLYFVWTEEYCQTSPQKIKSQNLWHVTSILVCCIFVRSYRTFLHQLECGYGFPALLQTWFTSAIVSVVFPLWQWWPKTVFRVDLLFWLALRCIKTLSIQNWWKANNQPLIAPRWNCPDKPNANDLMGDDPISTHLQKMMRSLGYANSLISNINYLGC